jgi:hypothetical protein
MSTITIVQSGRRYNASAYVVRVPAVGAWCAEVSVGSTEDLVAGACTIEHAGGDAWTGTVRRVHTLGARTTLDIRAGADGLDRTTTARHWAGFTDAAEVLRTLATDAGETVATEAVPLGSWRARGRTLRAELEALARWVSASGWRYTTSGALEMLAPAWAAASPPGASLASGAGWRAYACEGLPPLAGATVAGERVGLATYAYTGQGVPSVDVRAERPTASYTDALVGGKLESESDGRATIRLDSGEVLGDVPLWHVPGVRAVVPAGVRVIVADLGGDPRQPVAFAAPFDGAADELRLCDAGGRVLREGDLVMLTVNSGPPVPTPLTFAPTITSAGAPGTGWSKVLA